MARYLFLRVLYTLPVIWLVVSLVFLLIHLVPGDPILQMLGEGAPVTDVQAARHAYGLDQSLGRQYLNYWEGVVHGDLGPSLRFNQSVTRLIAQRYPYTLSAQCSEPVRFVFSQLRSRTHPHTDLRHKTRLASSLGFG
jgi:ABC-type dipeptide/oligopeptide/nickel transport system permease component